MNYIQPELHRENKNNFIYYGVRNLCEASENDIEFILNREYTFSS